MPEILQPSNSEQATYYCIAWDIVKAYVSSSDVPYTPEQVASIVSHTVGKMTRNPDPTMLDEYNLSNLEKVSPASSSKPTTQEARP